MGTRADFYVGKGIDAEWIGSIAWDGYRGAIDDAVLDAHSESDFRAAVLEFFDSRDDVTLPERGWPWPWDDSATTDCSYWFFDGRVWDAVGSWSYAGGPPGDFYAPCDEPEPNWGSGDETALFKEWLTGREKVEFPNMKDRKNVRFDQGSGIILVTATAR